MYTPLFSIFDTDFIKADVYHCVSTGYAGLIASYESFINKKPMILTEHGIYTREREEELIKSDWVEKEFKDTWIQFFKILSDAAYEQANIVVALFEKNRRLQIELGCQEQKTRVIHNGIKDSFVNQNRSSENALKMEREKKEGNIIVGGIVRVVPIKDIITMLSAFSIVEKQRDNVSFVIIGPIDEDEEYYEECLTYMKLLDLKRVVFTGRVMVHEYMKTMDIHVLTSISEGQPLTVLESLIYKIPNITTDVGDCSAMIYGNNDSFGPAGMIAKVMDSEGIAREIIKLVDNKELRVQYGINGYKRVLHQYNFDKFIADYKDIYESMM
jgi:glycosyltransferase involved in cell wall biosynthesis